MLIVAFSVGLALVLIAIGMLMVYARRLVARFDERGPLVTRWLPLTSSAVMTLLGASIAVQALASGLVSLEAHMTPTHEKGGSIMRHASRGMASVALVTLLAFVGGTAGAASHSDAPLIKQDPQANLTDVYAFVGTKYNNPNEKVLNVIVHVRPFSEPGDGVHLRAVRRRRALQHPHRRPGDRGRR